MRRMSRKREVIFCSCNFKRHLAKWFSVNGNLFSFNKIVKILMSKKHCENFKQFQTAFFSCTVIPLLNRKDRINLFSSFTKAIQN